MVGLSHCLSLWSLSRLQTFQEVEDGEEPVSELCAGEKSPLDKSFSQSSLYRRKSTRGSSFAASEGKKDEKEKFQDDQDKTEEVSCAARLLGLGGWVKTSGLRSKKDQKSFVKRIFFTSSTACVLYAFTLQPNNHQKSYH